MKRVKLVVAAGVLLLSMGTAHAAAKGEVFVPGKSLSEQIARIETELNDGETYAELKLEQRSQVREALGRMRGTLEQHPNQATLPDAAKTELYNDQQVVNTVLTQAREDSRLICRREKAIGSNMATTQCMTVAQRQRMKDKAQKDMGAAQRVGKFAN
ncbi:hypothetical protein [Stenotrophomonas rhizophila]|uniref:hypothetical protein n=1 Tax=Stenotrophomonas rhizophila TaxID=216778 RepID=UPI00226C481D|nr:hypothetical protein [Stenotrophomonas rhizophila]